MRKLSLLLLLLPSSLAAQSVITVAPSQCVWQAGNDPAMADPGLDDSKWVYSDSAPKGFAHLWMRCRVQLGSLRGLEQPAIQVRANAAYDLFVDGSRIGAAGNLASGQLSENLTRSFPLPANLIHDSISIIAVRATVRGDQVVTPFNFQSITLRARRRLAARSLARPRDPRDHSAYSALRRYGCNPGCHRPHATGLLLLRSLPPRSALGKHLLRGYRTLAPECSMHGSTARTAESTWRDPLHLRKCLLRLRTSALFCSRRPAPCPGTCGCSTRCHKFSNFSSRCRCFFDPVRRCIGTVPLPQSAI